MYVLIQQVIGSSLITLPVKGLDLPSIKSHNWRIWPCSAMTGDNLIKGLDWVVEDVARRLYYSSTVVQETSTSKQSVS